MELKTGMYVRTKKDGIGKITKIEEFIPFDDHIYLDSGKGDITFQNKNMVCKVNCRGNIVKASFNIIDLIEVGDYVNGYKVTNIDCGIDGKTIRLFTTENDIFINDIKSVVTKEMYSNVEYRVETN